MTDKNVLKNQINQIQNTYYDENNKSRFIKTKQKFSCAENVATKVGLDNLIEKSIFYDNDNDLFFDYTIFKTYAHPDIYDYITCHIVNMIKYGLDNFPNFSIKVNIQSLTITAIERYKDIIMKLTSTVPPETIHRIDHIYFINSTNMVKNIMMFVSTVFSKEYSTIVKNKVISD